jgi:hypothetical protein
MQASRLRVKAALFNCAVLVKTAQGQDGGSYQDETNVKETKT